MSKIRSIWKENIRKKKIPICTLVYRLRNVLNEVIVYVVLSFLPFWFSSSSGKLAIEYLIAVYSLKDVWTSKGLVACSRSVHVPACQWWQCRMASSLLPPGPGILPMNSSSSVELGICSCCADVNSYFTGKVSNVRLILTFGGWGRRMASARPVWATEWDSYLIKKQIGELLSPI